MCKPHRPSSRGRVFGGNCLLFGWRQCIIYGTCRRDGIGRRTGLKIPRWRHRAGSTPAAGTTRQGPGAISRSGPFALPGISARVQSRSNLTAHTSSLQATYPLRRVFHFIAKLVARSFCCSSLSQKVTLGSPVRLPVPFRVQGQTLFAYGWNRFTRRDFSTGGFAPYGTEIFSASL